MEKDPYYKSCIPLYVSTLVHLNKVTRKKKKRRKKTSFLIGLFIIYTVCFIELFEIAHSLVKQYPQDAVIIMQPLISNIIVLIFVFKINRFHGLQSAATIS